MNPIKSFEEKASYNSFVNRDRTNLARLMAGAVGCFVYPMEVEPKVSLPKIEILTPVSRLSDNQPSVGSKVISSLLGGAIGALVCYPFEGLKKRLQSGQTLTVRKDSLFAKGSPFHPKELFRGSTPFAASVTLATVTSMTFNRVLKNWPSSKAESSLSEAQCAFISGMLGAVIGSTPVENVILVQQLKKTTPFGAMKIMTKQGLTRPWVGLPELMIREAGFSFVMLYGASATELKVRSITNSDSFAFMGSLGLGVLGAIATQPFDTLATIRQKADGTITPIQAVSKIFQQNGSRGFFRGLSQRLFLFTGCATIIPRVESSISSMMA